MVRGDPKVCERDGVLRMFTRGVWLDSSRNHAERRGHTSAAADIDDVGGVLHAGIKPQNRAFWQSDLFWFRR